MDWKGDYCTVNNQGSNVDVQGSFSIWLSSKLNIYVGI